MQPAHPNFGFLAEHDPLLAKLPLLAERYVHVDPNTALIKLRQFVELLARRAAARLGIGAGPETELFQLLRGLEDSGAISRELASIFHLIRKTGNEASHAFTGTSGDAIHHLKLARQLAIWYHTGLGRPRAFKPGPFVPPQPPADSLQALKKQAQELDAQAAKLRTERDEASRQLAAALEESQAYDARARAAEGDAEVALALAAQAEAVLAYERERFNAGLVQMNTEAEQAPSDQRQAAIAQAGEAAALLDLDEADTRKLIDQQLRDVGWEVDTVVLRHNNGTRPERGKNLAIAEWPTASGPADYVLFVGLTPVATVEAKRSNIDVSGALQQAKRYSRDFSQPAEAQSPGGPWSEYQIPFAFSSNGRPYLRQLSTKSGIWFCDLRRPDNIGHVLDGWYTPDGLSALLKRDERQAHDILKNEPFDYGFTLRPYQQSAIKAVEAGIAEGQREMLLAMATGTGKTKTCIALIYRLLKAKRFRRVLFLVDRSALGEQAANAFKDTRMDSLQTFADIFGIKELGDQEPDSATAVHVATVQGMVQRALYPGEAVTPPAVDQYDCIVVDECHRGYLLDRELSDTELGFRSYDDYISKYRRVLDYFDAYKIGLTATPALHTTQIFGPPIYAYSYREAVIDGYLIDHEPPVQITTELSQSGIVWEAGEEVPVYQAQSSQIELFTTPDEIKIEVEGFNRKVITESFNRVVCSFLAQELDPASLQKTLIFCANDAHADLVVDLLKQAFKDQYGSVEDDAVVKITGAADKPLQLLRRYKNERNPNVAVTVDLLTTGVDIHEICNLVFLRRVNSRILFDQMLGRATRLCDEIGKETFRIFDAVNIYEALQNLTAMQPVVVNPAISFSQLAAELAEVTTDAERNLARDQFLAKLQRKKRHLSDSAAQDFETCAGLPPDAFIQQLRTMSLGEIATWFTENRDLGEILDGKTAARSAPVFVSDHEDQLVGTERGYGGATRPEDYLEGFSQFVRTHRNDIPALVTVLTRPRDLTRKQLRELALELDRAGFSEASLATAWRETTNQDIAARIIGYVRQAAIGDPLVPYEQRVESALQKMLASRSWTTPQRQWLQKLAAQTNANLVVDREALDDPDLVFQREGGGFNRLDRIFSGELQKVLDTFNESLWTPAA